MLKVKPRDGLKIRDPQRGDLIEPEGRVVPRTTYWLHRLRDRDVVLVVEADEKKPAPTTNKTTRKPVAAGSPYGRPSAEGGGDANALKREPCEINVSVSEIAQANEELA